MGGATMNKLLVAATSAVMLAGITQVNAAVTGNDWQSYCANDKKPGEFAACIYYTRGLADGLTLWEMAKPEAAFICIPAEVTGRQLVDVGMKYLREHPAERHKSAAYLLALAFIESDWVCRKQPKTDANAK